MTLYNIISINLFYLVKVPSVETITWYANLQFWQLYHLHFPASNTLFRRFRLKFLKASNTLASFIQTSFASTAVTFSLVVFALKNSLLAHCFPAKCFTVSAQDVFLVARLHLFAANTVDHALVYLIELMTFFSLPFFLIVKSRIVIHLDFTASTSSSPATRGHVSGLVLAPDIFLKENVIFIRNSALPLWYSWLYHAR